MIRETHELASLADKLPPSNLEAEMGVLGSILSDPDALHEVLPVLRADEFYRDDHGTVYRAVRDIVDGGGSVDYITVNDVLARTRPRPGGWIDLLTDLANGVPHSANASYYASIVRQKSDTRRVIAAANAVLRRAYANDSSADELLATAQAEFLAIGDRDRGGSEVSLADAVGQTVDLMRRRWAGEEPGVSAPWPKLNETVGGFHPGRLYVVAGRPGTGKSALLMNLADHAAMEGGIASLLFSLEMDACELGERYLSARADVNGYGLRRPQDLDRPRLDSIDAAAAAADSSRLRIDDAGGLPVSQIAARARRCKHRRGLGLILVDYLQLADGSVGRKETRQEEVARVSRGLKNLAKELKVPVVAACQLNRAVENRAASEQVPRMSDLRESGQIEQDAHAIMLLHSTPEAPDLVTVDVAKNRGGSTGALTLRFVRSRTRFEDFDPAAGYVPPPAY